MVIIPIVFCADENYATYVPTLMHSVLKHASPEHEYRFYFFYNNTSDQTLQIVQDEVADCKNAFLTCIDVGAYLEEYKDLLITNLYLSNAAYARFFIPALLPQYDKVLYLDIDILVKADVSELYEKDLHNHILGVIADGYFEEKVKRNRDGMSDYFYNVLRLPEEHYYFNSGVLLINAQKWRSEHYTQKCLDALAQLKEPVYNDQCILNYVCAGDVQYIPMQWNYRCGYEPADLPGSQKYDVVSAWVKEAQKNPSLTHFMGARKPWYLIESETDEEDFMRDEYSKMALEWWNNARDTKSIAWLEDRKKGQHCPSFKEKPILGFIKVRRTVTTKTIYLFGFPIAKRIKAHGQKGIKLFGINLKKLNNLS